MLNVATAPRFLPKAVVRVNPCQTAGMAKTERTALDGATLLAQAQDVLPDVVDLRRRIHAEPEVGLDLPKTQAKILDALADLDLEISTGSDSSMVVATLKGGAEGPTLLLRGDMDALPMPEDTGLSFASTTPNTMHACGHDAHVAMLVGAAKILTSQRADLAGNVKFFFQPGEEGYFGAKYAIAEGLLENPTVDGAFALHIAPNIPSGVVASKGGALMAAADEVAIRVVGRGGHASAPFSAADPVPVACEIVIALQTMITRTVDIFDPGVLTIASIQGGTAYNVIPEDVRLLGTLRTVSEKTRSAILASITRVVDGIAAAHGCEAEISIKQGYPVTVNDSGFAEMVLEVLGDTITETMVMPAPIMGAEDWSYVLAQVPGAMAFIGVCPPGLEADTAPACHSNRMLLDEDAMAIGVASHVAVARRYLS